jgi:hypothetical protein
MHSLALSSIRPFFLFCNKRKFPRPQVKELAIRVPDDRSRDLTVLLPGDSLSSSITVSSPEEGDPSLEEFTEAKSTEGSAFEDGHGTELTGIGLLVHDDWQQQQCQEEEQCRLFSIKNKVQ